MIQVEPARHSNPVVDSQLPATDVGHDGDTAGRVSGAMAHALFYEQALGKLGGAFHARGLAPMVVKGQAIADLAYDEQVRMSCDVDLLVADDEQAVIDVLLQIGYSELRLERRAYSAPLLGERVFQHRSRSMPTVDLHSRLDKLILRAVDYAAILRRGQASRFAGLRYPEANDLWMLVVLHAACDFDRNDQRVLDDLQRLAACGAVDLNICRDRAKAWGLLVAQDSWVARLLRERQVNHAQPLDNDRWPAISLAVKWGKRLPIGWRYFAVLAPWYDSAWTPLWGIGRYAAMRVADRIIRPEK